MNKFFMYLFLFSVTSLLASAAPSPDHGGYGAPSSGYHAPSSGYGAPRPSYHAPPSYHDDGKTKVVHVHHHYSHEPKPTYEKPTYYPKPSYHQPSYHHSSSYQSPELYHDDDEYIHLHKKELTRSALLLGAGILKGVIITGLINNANNGVTIGKKK